VVFVTEPVGFKSLLSVPVFVTTGVVVKEVAVVLRPVDVVVGCTIENCCDWAKMVVRWSVS